MDFNIYNDLDSFDNAVKLEKFEKENICLKESVQELEEKLSKETEKAEKLEKLSNNLKINISKLFKTARAEIERKDKMIAYLRQKNNNFVFRRQNRDHSTVHDTVHTNSNENAKYFSNDTTASENIREYKTEEKEKIELEGHTTNKNIHNNLSVMNYNSIELSNSLNDKKNPDDVKKNVDNKSNIVNSDYIPISNIESSTTLKKFEKENENYPHSKSEDNKYSKYPRNRRKSISPYKKDNKYLQEKKSNQHINLDKRKFRERSRSPSKERPSYRNNLKRRGDRSHSSDKFSYSESNQSRSDYLYPKRNHNSYRNTSRSPIHNSKKYKNDKYEIRSDLRNKNQLVMKDEYRKSKLKNESIKYNTYKGNQNDDEYKRTSTAEVKPAESITKDLVKESSCIKIETATSMYSCNEITNNYNKKSITISPSNETIQNTECKLEVFENYHSNNDIAKKKDLPVNNENIDNNCVVKDEIHDPAFLENKNTLSVLNTNTTEVHSNQIEIKTEENTQLSNKCANSCSEYSLTDLNRSANENSTQIILPDIVSSSKYPISSNDSNILNKDLKSISSDIDHKNDFINENTSKFQGVKSQQMKMRDNIYSKVTLNPNKIRITVRKNRNT